MSNTLKESKNNRDTINFDICRIYEKIAPYLSDPEYIKSVLDDNNGLSREELIKIIEINIKESDISTIKRTDLRILLDSI